MDIIDELRSIVGDRGILTGDDVHARSCDPFRNKPAASGALARPSSTEELSRVMALCHARNQRVVIHGGRTGVSGGAYADECEIIISLERMNRIEEICPISETAVVEAGVTLEALQDAVGQVGLFYPVDLASKGTATMGGMIATNAGGNRVLRWGMTRQNLLGLEVVLADGTVVSSMNRLVKNNTGYDLKHLFVGSEGTLGIVTRAVARLVQAPASQLVAFVSVASYDNLLALLKRARRLVTLSAFEVMWRDYYELLAASGTDRRPLSPGQPYYVLIEAMGHDKEADESLFESFLKSIYDDQLVVEAVLATSGKQVADLWRVREGAEVIVREFKTFISVDVSIDVENIDRFIGRTKAVLQEIYPDLRTATFGHLGDNNIHLAINVGADTVREETNVERHLFAVVKEFSGAITAEHGIGRLKREFLPQHRTGPEMELMRSLRRAIDPQCLLNREVLF